MSSTSTAPVVPAAPASDLLRRWIQPLLLQGGLAHWLPICSLNERHRPLLERHLLALSERDRYLRFGYPATDERIRQHVAHLDFARHELFGIFDRRLELLATAHLAYTDEREACEFAVSVVPQARGRGFGKRLFTHAMRHCQNRRVHRLFIHALSENTAMLRIARGAGATIRPEGSESEAWLELPPDSLGSHMTELVDSRAAGLNYLVKRQGLWLQRLAGLVAEVKSHFARTRGVAGQ